MAILDGKTYKPVGHCIYCGETKDLRREHILPFGLSGTAVLPESTCGRCAKATAMLEQKILRGPMWAIRVYRQLKSRTKHKDAPKTYPLKVARGGVTEQIEVPLEDYPILLHFPVFPSPGFVRGRKDLRGIDLQGVLTISFGIGPDVFMEKSGATSIEQSWNHEPVAFARMLAKIAYAYAAAEGQLAWIEGASTVLPAILGEDDDVGVWVGTYMAPAAVEANTLHSVAIQQDYERGLLIGVVHLFSDSQTPSYAVILGKLRTPAVRN